MPLNLPSLPAAGPTARRGTRGTRRGFILLDALVGAAIVSITLVAVFQFVGIADVEMSRASHRTVALEALQDGIDRYRAARYANITNGTIEAAWTPYINAGTLVDRSITVTDLADTSALCRMCKRVTVQVRYKVRGVYKTHSATTLVNP